MQHSTEQICDVLKAELQGRIRYDSATVFSRLRTDDVDDAFVSRCLAGFSTDLGVQYAMKTLQDLKNMAELSKTDSEFERQKQEKSMYQPLVRPSTTLLRARMLTNYGQSFFISYALSLELLRTPLPLRDHVVLLVSKN